MALASKTSQTLVLIVFFFLFEIYCKIYCKPFRWQRVPLHCSPKIKTAIYGENTCRFFTSALDLVKGQNINQYQQNQKPTENMQRYSNDKGNKDRAGTKTCFYNFFNNESGKQMARYG